MCYRGYFRKNIFQKCVLCKKKDNNINHVINECVIIKELRDKLKNDLEVLDRKTTKLNLLKLLNKFLLL